MNKRFYLIDSLNDPSLENTYVDSLPEEIQPELNKMVATAQMDFSTMFMGQIHLNSLWRSLTNHVDNTSISRIS